MPVKYLVGIIDDASADTLSFIINEHSLNFKDLKVSLRKETGISDETLKKT